MVAVALFQCKDTKSLSTLSSAITAKPPQARVTVKTKGFLLGIVFQFDCIAVYHYCMKMAARYFGRVAFIGIDETITFIDDPYRLAVLSKIYHKKYKRSYEELAYLNELKANFYDAISKYTYTSTEILNICRCSYLQPDDEFGVEFCAKEMNSIINGPFSSWPLAITNIPLRVEELCDAEWTCHTTIRSMAHFCYLGLDKFQQH